MSAVTAVLLGFVAITTVPMIASMLAWISLAKVPVKARSFGSFCIGTVMPVLAAFALSTQLGWKDQPRHLDFVLPGLAVGLVISAFSVCLLSCLARR